MEKRKEIGKKGEELAVKYLKKRGYHIIETNFQTRHGEIDIIAKKGKRIIFIEVKTRKNRKYGLAKEAIDIKKQKKLYQTAQYYLHFNHIKNNEIQFDAIEIYIQADKIKINHIVKIITENPFF